MRRLVLSLLAASSVALLTACGQGGSAFNVSNNTKVDRVSIQSAGQPPGVLKVVPGGTIGLSAIGTRGSLNTINSADTNYTFNYGYAVAGTPYQNNQDGIQAFCAGFLQQPPTPASGVVPAPVALPITNLPSNSKQFSQNNVSTDSINFTAPTAAAIAALNPPIAPIMAAPAPASYCVIVNATHTSDGVVGSAVIYVGN